mmetsp:Transcript_11633/g.25908  ORF Transcript_11633/g.25908 Transcript_11633/m.25908 type:complete len:208 (+) Transcript_11633:166-789(+)
MRSGQKKAWAVTWAGNLRQSGAKLVADTATSLQVASSSRSGFTDAADPSCPSPAALCPGFGCRGMQVTQAAPALFKELVSPINTCSVRVRLNRKSLIAISFTMARSLTIIIESEEFSHTKHPMNFSRDNPTVRRVMLRGGRHKVICTLRTDTPNCTLRSSLGIGEDDPSNASPGGSGQCRPKPSAAPRPSSASVRRGRSPAKFIHGS